MKVQIIIGSVRPGRVSERVAKWVAQEAAELEDTTVEIVDLKDYPLPLFDEAVSPQYNPDRQPEGAVKEWLSKLAEGDAYIIVSPEYNRSIPGPMKNALDYIDYQLKQKPVALVTHGSTGGAQAMANYRAVLPQLYAVTVPEPTFITGAAQSINEAGELDAEVKANPYGPYSALQATLTSLLWYSKALTVAR